MKKLSLREGVIMLLFLFVSCTPTSDDILLEEEITKVEFMLPDSSISADSRMNIVVGSGVKYNWTNTDSIGIFPDDGYQVAFPLKTTGESSSATFTGGGWALKAGSTYAAYYPFEYNNRRSDSIPVSYLGQKQIGNNSTDLADKYNYMYATGDKTGDNALTFKMLRLGRFIILKFAVSEPTTLSSVKLTAPEDVFITQGYFNLWDNPHVIESLQTSNSLTIDLEDVKTTEANEEVTVYFFMPPVNLSGKTLALEVTDENNVKIQYMVAGKDMTDSKAYALTGVIKEPVVGNGTYQNGVVSLSQAGTMKRLLGSDYKNITSLKVVGPINGDDIYDLRKMLGGSDFSEADWGELTSLDLSEATIVEGGVSYYDKSTSSGDEYYTSNNVIGDYMFYQCANLQNMILPKDVISIDEYAFYNCDALIDVSIFESATSVGEYAFYSCDALASISIPDNVISAGDYAFAFCSNLVKVNIGKGLTEISNYMFAGNSLTSVVIPDNITSINARAFYECYYLETITIGNGVSVINHHAFESTPIKSIYIKDLSAWCKIDFCDEYYEQPFFEFGNIYLNNTLLTELQIPEDVTKIKSCAFYGCSSITKVVIPNHVFSIEDNAFRSSSIDEVAIYGSGNTSIGKDAFYSCTDLKYVYIDDGVTSIGETAFLGVML